MALGPCNQVVLCPLQARQFLRQDSLSLDLRGFEPCLTRMVFTHLVLHLLKTFLAKCLAAEAPTSSKLCQGLLIHLLQSAPLEAPLKFLPTKCTVLLDAVLAQQTVNAQPLRPVLARGQIQREAAPGVSKQAVFWDQQ